MTRRDSYEYERGNADGFRFGVEAAVDVIAERRGLDEFDSETLLLIVKESLSERLLRRRVAS